MVVGDGGDVGSRVLLERPEMIEADRTGTEHGYVEGGFFGHEMKYEIN
jgi:hypothetical protein